MLAGVPPNNVNLNGAEGGVLAGVPPNNVNLNGELYGAAGLPNDGGMPNPLNLMAAYVYMYMNIIDNIYVYMSVYSISK